MESFRQLFHTLGQSWWSPFTPRLPRQIIQKLLLGLSEKPPFALCSKKGRRKLSFKRARILLAVITGQPAERGAWGVSLLKALCPGGKVLNYTHTMPSSLLPIIYEMYAHAHLHIISPLLMFWTDWHFWMAVIWEKKKRNQSLTTQHNDKNQI